MKTFTFDQVGCGRCLADRHPQMTFTPLTHPVVAGAYLFTHWAPCPTNGEPILLTLTGVSADG